MRASTVVLLLIGLATSSFAFFVFFSIFALQQHGQSGKSFQSILASSNFSSIAATVQQDLQLIKSSILETFDAEGNASFPGFAHTFTDLTERFSSSRFYDHDSNTTTASLLLSRLYDFTNHSVVWPSFLPEDLGTRDAQTESLTEALTQAGTETADAESGDADAGAEKSSGLFNLWDSLQRKRKGKGKGKNVTGDLLAGNSGQAWHAPLLLLQAVQQQEEQQQGEQQKEETDGEEGKEQKLAAPHDLGAVVETILGSPLVVFPQDIVMENSPPEVLAREAREAALQAFRDAVNAGTKAVQGAKGVSLKGGLVLKAGGKHPAVPEEEGDSEQTQTNRIKGSESATAHPAPIPTLSCQRSYEPTCDMYPYVRFWNKEFHPQDCYASPLQQRNDTPWAERKFVTFEPDCGGWNNIRMAAETAIIFAHATGRTLVQPPSMVIYLLHQNKKQNNLSNLDKFFDLRKLGLTVVSMQDFLTHVAHKGLLKKSPESLGPSPRPKVLFRYLEQANFVRHWEPGKFFMGFNLSMETGAGGVGGAGRGGSGQETFGTFQRSGRRYTEMVAHGRALVPYDEGMHAEIAIHFVGCLADRLLTHFYSYLYWEKFHTEQIYKRIVRDRLHYHDDIFCAAGRAVRLLHQDAATLTEKEVQGPAMANRKTLGGDSNHNATYFAFHIRRGDFQYKNTRLSAQTIWSNTRHLLDPAVSTLIYIATDERNRSFFEPFFRPPFTVKFLADYAVSAGLTEDAHLNLNHLGMVEQVICANAHTFIGTPLSTFTGYITRMRGYYRDGRYERSYYTLARKTYDLQKQRPLVGPFWAREFEKAHRDIDDWTDEQEAGRGGGGEIEV